MGICLDTESNWAAIEEEEQNNENNGSPTLRGKISSDLSIVFVIGGPGSGKVSHSERLSQELIRNGILHLNVTELLKDIFRLNDALESLHVPTSEVTRLIEDYVGENESRCRGLIISGYPRSLTDLWHYLEHGVGRVDGAVLLNWHEDAIQAQIEYGASQGQVDLATARSEWKHFKKNVIPVAEYFDSKQLLYVVNGERPPEEVYSDFSVAFERISRIIRPQSQGSYRQYKNEFTEARNGIGIGFINEKESGITAKQAEVSVEAATEQEELPPIIWITGGPGSSKTRRMEECLTAFPGWRLVSSGRLLWAWTAAGLEEDDSEELEQAKIVGQLMAQGELVPSQLVIQLIWNELEKHRGQVKGFFIIGFPREMTQANLFEERMMKVQLRQQRPKAILIDCSELELGRNLGQRRGRPDDNLEAYKRRLQHYREHCLPMLKALDEQQRLKIVDGDVEEKHLVNQLAQCIKTMIVASESQNEGEGIEKTDRPNGFYHQAAAEVLDRALLKVDNEAMTNGNNDGEQ